MFFIYIQATDKGLAVPLPTKLKTPEYAQVLEEDCPMRIQYLPAAKSFKGWI